jgi:hypothetical protein
MATKSKVNLPSAFETAVRATPLLVSSNVRDALGTAAPEASTTVPFTLAVVI